MAEDTVRICPNPKCRLVFRPDSRIYRNADLRCPKCGTDLNQKPLGRKRSDDGY